MENKLQSPVQSPVAGRACASSLYRLAVLADAAFSASNTFVFSATEVTIVMAGTMRQLLGRIPEEGYFLGTQALGLAVTQYAVSCPSKVTLVYPPVLG